MWNDLKRIVHAKYMLAALLILLPAGLFFSGPLLGALWYSWSVLFVVATIRDVRSWLGRRGAIPTTTIANFTASADLDPRNDRRSSDYREQLSHLWSARPGCYERHLQRRTCGVLFPLERRTVTEQELSEAKSKDADDARDLRKRSTEFMRSFIDGPDIVGASMAADCHAKVRELQIRNAEIGADDPDIKNALDTARAQISEAINRCGIPNVIDAWRKADRALEETDKLSLNPFIAQMNRSDTPIRDAEIITSLLTEDLLTVQLTLQVFRDNPTFLRQIYDEWRHLLKENRKAGLPVFQGDEKIMAIKTALSQQDPGQAIQGH